MDPAAAAAAAAQAQAAAAAGAGAPAPAADASQAQLAVGIAPVATDAAAVNVAAVAAQQQQAAAAAAATFVFDAANVDVYLGHASTADPATRQLGEQYFDALEMANLELFWQLLVTKLATRTEDVALRMLAGILLKRSIAGQDDEIVESKVLAWEAMSAEFRAGSKGALLAALADPQLMIRRTSASTIGKLALVEVPKATWPELIPQLVANVQQDADAPLKHGSLEALGYICEEIDPALLKVQSNAILTAVCKGCTDADLTVRLSALRALNNSLEFASENMKRKEERDYIVRQIMDASACAEDEEIRKEAFECMVILAARYYEHLPEYMQGLFNATLEAIKGDEDEVVLQAIEFWSTLCDEEIFLLEEAEDLAELGQAPTQAPLHFVRGALQYLIPLLTMTLCKQDDEPDEDEWTPAMAAGTCLSLVAQTVGDHVVQYVMPFVQASIVSENWKEREAATLAFGSILFGPKSDQVMVQLVLQAIPRLTQQMRDPVPYVKDTTTWTIGRMLDLYGEHIVDTPQMNEIAVQLLAALDDQPKIAAKACWSVHNHAAALEEQCDAKTSTLSNYYETYLVKLLEVASRADAGEANLRTSAYEAVAQVISAGAQDMLPRLGSVHVPELIRRLHESFSMPIVSMEDRDAMMELQGLLCGALQVSMKRLNADAAEHADTIMGLATTVLTSTDATVHEEALMLIGFVADALGPGFGKFVPDFLPVLQNFLLRPEEAQVCDIAIGCLGDVTRAVGEAIAPFMQPIMDALLANLRAPTVSRDLKPPIIAVFGDLALCATPQFAAYIPTVAEVLVAAAATPMDDTDYDMIDFVNSLRRAILDAHTGIIQGLSSLPEPTAAYTYAQTVEAIIPFVTEIATNSLSSPEVFTAAVGIIGDIASIYKAKFAAHLSAPWVTQFIQKCLQMDTKAQQAATYAHGCIAAMHTA